jgi:hypothetical protein
VSALPVFVVLACRPQAPWSIGISPGSVPIRTPDGSGLSPDSAQGCPPSRAPGLRVSGPSRFIARAPGPGGGFCLAAASRRPGPGGGFHLPAASRARSSATDSTDSLHREGPGSAAVSPSHCIAGGRARRRFRLVTASRAPGRGGRPPSRCIADTRLAAVRAWPLRLARQELACDLRPASLLRPVATRVSLARPQVRCGPGNAVSDSRLTVPLAPPVNYVPD